jgi:murein endopeptidase
MKQYLKNSMIAMFAIAAISATCLCSCSKDDDKPSNTEANTLKYDGKTYQLVSSEVADYEDYYGNGTFNYGIRIYTSSDDLIEVDVLLAAAGFPQGSKTYNYSASHQAGTMDAFFYALGADSNQAEQGEIKSGSATISRNGNVYEISFNVTTLENKTIAGHYKETVD